MFESLALMQAHTTGSPPERQRDYGGREFDYRAWDVTSSLSLSRLHVVMHAFRARVREALVETSLAGVTQPLSGPADLGDHGKPRVSQLQSRCSQAAKYAP